MEIKTTVPYRSKDNSVWRLICPECGRVIAEDPDVDILVKSGVCEHCNIKVQRII